MENTCENKRYMYICIGAFILRILSRESDGRLVIFIAQTFEQLKIGYYEFDDS